MGAWLAHIYLLISNLRRFVPRHKRETTPVCLSDTELARNVWSATADHPLPPSLPLCLYNATNHNAIIIRDVVSILRPFASFGRKLAHTSDRQA